MSYLNLRLYQRNTQCLHIRKHRLAGFFVRLFVACAFAAQTPLSSAELYFNPRFLADDPRLWLIYRVLKMGKNYRQGRIVSISI